MENKPRISKDQVFADFQSKDYRGEKSGNGSGSVIFGVIGLILVFLGMFLSLSMQNLYCLIMSVVGVIMLVACSVANPHNKAVKIAMVFGVGFTICIIGMVLLFIELCTACSGFPG